MLVASTEEKLGVDIGHDDRTTIKLSLYFYLCNLPLLQTVLLALLSHYTLPYAFKVNYFLYELCRNIFFIKRDFRTDVIYLRH